MPPTKAPIAAPMPGIGMKVVPRKAPTEDPIDSAAASAGVPGGSTACAAALPRYPPIAPPMLAKNAPELKPSNRGSGAEGSPCKENAATL
jgi:hypothetical protein